MPVHPSRQAGWSGAVGALPRSFGGLSQCLVPVVVAVAARACRTIPESSESALRAEPEEGSYLKHRYIHVVIIQNKYINRKCILTLNNTQLQTKDNLRRARVRRAQLFRRRAISILFPISYTYMFHVKLRAHNACLPASHRSAGDRPEAVRRTNSRLARIRSSI